MAGRYWGIWTRGKLDLLRRYLEAFTTASKSQREIVYLDLFGGQPENYDRLTGERLAGSPEIAMSITPPFTKLRFFELESQAAALEVALRANFPNRDFAVIPGDVNARVHETLTELRRVNWAPTFAFIDPNGPDTHWTTLQALARHKHENLTKVELWLLFPAALFTRNLPTDGRTRPDDEAAITRMYGTDLWQAIYQRRVDEVITPAEAREEYVNLMRWRLQTVLGYVWTHPLEVLNERGGPLYHMIFATDHDAGDRIMRHLYAQAAADFPAMREAARRRRARDRERHAGIMSLFEEPSGLDVYAPARGDERFYEYLPPWPPPGVGDVAEES